MAVEALSTSFDSLIPSLETNIKSKQGVKIQRQSSGGAQIQDTRRVDRLADRKSAMPVQSPREPRQSNSVVRQVNVSAEEVERQPEDEAGIGRSLDVFA